jgi:class 3 adenylate cyclase
MPLKDELTDEVRDIFVPTWDTQATVGIPEADQVRLTNHAKELASATVLYADLDGSTNMVDTRPWWFSAEIYKAYLRCAARIIRDEGGVITAYDGDRIMAIYVGGSKNTNAVRAALRINGAVRDIVQPAISRRPQHADFVLKHVIGIDTGELRAARIGVRGYNDLVWVGRAANYAAKLTALGEQPIWITGEVYDQSGLIRTRINGFPIWSERSWTAMNGMRIYCTDSWCAV